MVRYGNPVSRWNGKWSKPVYVSGEWSASNHFFGGDPHPGYPKRVQEFVSFKSESTKIAQEITKQQEIQEEKALKEASKFTNLKFECTLYT
jgi:hypothetical protein